MQSLPQRSLLSGSQHRSAALLTFYSPRATRHRGAHNRSLQHGVRSQSAGAGSTSREPHLESVSFRQNSGAAASTSTVIDVTDDSQRQDRMQEVISFLRGELATIFTTGVGL